MPSSITNIGVIGNYLPRKCGIATFTTDLAQSISAVSDAKCWVAAINDQEDGYDYPDNVHYEINQNAINQYSQSAEFLNTNLMDVVSLQHEFGIFGGHDGGYVLNLLKDLRMPVIATLHTVLNHPKPTQRSMFTNIIKECDRVVIMAETARKLLKNIYEVPDEKIVFIPHGIPDIPFVDPSFYKDQFGVEGRKVILTFGLLSPGKGIEQMVKALPDIVKKYPEAIYMVLGATHPATIRANGESYRISLEQMAKKLNVSENIIFHNRFVELKELSEFLGSADVYVTPYLQESQMVSGTLAYALGAGKAVVSTPYLYANEMLADGRGVIVPVHNPKAMAEAVIDLFDDETKRHAMRKRGYLYSRKAIWREVAMQYLRVFEEVKLERMGRPRPVSFPRTLEKKQASLPELRLNHMIRLTDETGILQHSRFSLPDREHGYCTDDNARALIVTLTAQRFLTNDLDLMTLQYRYLSFLQHAFNPATGRFRNFMDYKRNWLEDEGSDDCHGRAIWALGINYLLSKNKGCQQAGAVLFRQALKCTEELASPRSIAFSLIGIHAYLSEYPGDSEVKRIQYTLAKKLDSLFKGVSQADWPWLEETVSYSNGKIPHALLLSGQMMKKKRIIDQGLISLDWLMEKQLSHNMFSPVGNKGWMTKDGYKAHFDQQPVESQTMMEACMAAYYVSKKNKYQDFAQKCFDWFLGQNDLNVQLYDYQTDGCCDGLTPDGANFNQGAESTLAWLQSLIAMHYIRAGENMYQRVE
ncbi:MAG: glycosyltransferase family 4 protein [Fibrobacteria bacterium]|nr:glycosyltransferase family 4 protein [Fibrobacteria bacterium]